MKGIFGIFLPFMLFVIFCLWNVYKQSGVYKVVDVHEFGSFQQ